MSASMYNSPYIYKEPLSKIKYPSFFSGCSISFKHIFDSQFLALSGLLFIISVFINLGCVISPFWFKLVFSSQDGTFGYEAVKRELSINTGIFFINENEMDNLVDLNKSNNQNVIPRMLVLAQVLEVMGMCSLVACVAGSVVLAMRRFASVTGSVILAFFASLTGICLAMVFLFALIMAMSSTCDPYDSGNSCRYEDNLKWRVYPIYSQFYRVEQVVTPLVKLNWTFYISIIPAVLTCGGAVLMWLDWFKTYRQISQIRYHQLRSVRDPHEGDINPADHRKYVYQAPVQSGSMGYGMQPVVFQGGPYGVPAVPYATPSAPQEHYRSGGVGFAEDPHEKKQRQSSSSSPPPSKRRSPPPRRRRSPSPDSGDDSPPPTRFGRIGRGGGGSPPPSHRRRSPSPPSPSAGRRRSPPPARRGGPPSLNSSMSEGPYISREIDL